MPTTFILKNNPLLAAALLTQKTSLTCKEESQVTELRAHLSKAIDYMAFAEVTLEELSDSIHEEENPEAYEETQEAAEVLNGIRMNISEILRLLPPLEAKKEEANNE